MSELVGRFGLAEVWQGDARRLDMLEDGSVQLILTDPVYNAGIPYPGYEDLLEGEAYWTMARDFLAEARRVLRHGGVLALLTAFTGHLVGLSDSPRRVSGFQPS